MNYVLKYILLSFFLFPVLMAQGQSDSSRFQLYRGFVKNLQFFSFTDPDTIQTTNLIHNRFEFRIRPFKKATIAVEMRNRIFTGETVKQIPDYGAFFKQDTDLVDLKYIALQSHSAVIITELDRLWFRYRGKKWELTLGKQRINWGINLFWNANDIFNTYSLFNFDYERRPGTDAIRFQVYGKNNSTWDFAYAPETAWKKQTAAVRYGFNKWQYDFQVLGGYWKDELALGGGWAGNIKTLGFKGEVTAFDPLYDNKGVDISSSVSLDYLFGKNNYLTVSGLYNSAATGSLTGFSTVTTSTTLSAKNLMPFKYSGLVSAQFPVNLNFTIGLTAIVAKDIIMALPSLTFVAGNNVDFNLYYQGYYEDSTGVSGHFISIRARYTF